MVYDYWRWPWSPVWSRVCQLSPCIASPCSLHIVFFAVVVEFIDCFGYSGSLLLCVGFSQCWLLSWSLGSVQGLTSCGSWAQWLSCGLSCPAVCGTFLEQGLNPRSLHWQADSELLDNQGNSILHSSEVNMHKPDLRRGELGFPFLRVEFLQALFGILLHERFTSSPTFINLFIISMALWVVILWVKMPCYLICCFTQIAPGLATRDSFSWLLGSLWHISIHFFSFVALSYLLAFYISLGSSCISPALILQLAIFLIIYSSFNWRMVLETKIQMKVCLLLLGCISFRPSQLTMYRNICLRIHRSINSSIRNHLYLHMSSFWCLWWIHFHVNQSNLFPCLPVNSHSNNKKPG